MPGLSTPALADLIAAELPDLCNIRHDLHIHPQLAYEETYASALVQRELTALGIPFQAGLAETGVVGWILPTDEEARRRPAVALRADMDALPITEATGLPYASQTPGLMHACGHDGHTTILLGAARILVGLRDRLPRPIKLLFQPAEEGGGGAAKLIEAGALEAGIGGVKVGHVFGLHGWPLLEVGAITTRPGPFMASMDAVDITLRGRGGHGAWPHLTNDPLVAAAQLITALQTVVARHIDPVEPAVVTIGACHAGQARNVIPDTVTLNGTIRALNTETARRIHQRVEELATGIAAVMGCRAEVEICPGYPPTVNDPAAAGYVQRVAAAALGDDRVQTLDRPVMGAEDFSFYGQRVPAAFFFLGLRPADRPDYPGLHTAHFDFNDDAIPVGIRVMCQLALQAAF